MTPIYEPLPVPEASDELVHARAAWAALAEETDTLPQAVEKAASEGRTKDFAELAMRQATHPARKVAAEREVVRLELAHAKAIEAYRRAERARATAFREERGRERALAMTAFNFANGAMEDARAEVREAVIETRRWIDRARAVGVLNVADAEVA